MSDDYLWDKSGSDEEVKRLERTLEEAKFARPPPTLPVAAAAEAAKPISEVPTNPPQPATTPISEVPTDPPSPVGPVAAVPLGAEPSAPVPLATPLAEAPLDPPSRVQTVAVVPLLTPPPTRRVTGEVPLPAPGTAQAQLPTAQVSDPLQLVSQPPTGAVQQLPAGKRPTAEVATQIPTGRKPTGDVPKPPEPSQVPTRRVTGEIPAQKRRMTGEHRAVPDASRAPTQLAEGKRPTSEIPKSEEQTQLPTRADFHVAPAPPATPQSPPPPPAAAVFDDATELPTRANFNVGPEDAPPRPTALYGEPKLEIFGDRVRRIDPDRPKADYSLLDQPTRVFDVPTPTAKERDWHDIPFEQPTSVFIPAAPATRRTLFARGRTPFIAAFGLAVVAGVWGWSAVTREETAVRRDWNMVPVVVASRDIPEGTELTFDMLAQRSIPVQFVSSSVVRPDSATYVLRQRVIVPLQAGDPFLWNEFETVRAAEHLSARIHHRARAMTIETNPTSGVGGWVRPSDHVDVIGTFRHQGDKRDFAVTLLQNVIVLATGSLSTNTNLGLLPEHKRKYAHVSLMVVPEEAEMLALATELGSLSLTLRNEDDIEGQDRGGANGQSIFTGERTRALLERRESIIDIIRQSPERRR